MEKNLGTGLTEDQKKLVKKATYASVAVAFLLMGMKYFAWLITDSVSLLATLVDSFLDAGASILNLFAVRHAMQPPSEEYKFGHGKAEALAALGQALFIIGSSIFLMFEAYEKFYAPEPVTETTIGIIIMVASIAITLILVRYQQNVVRQTKSLAISADSLHYFSDVLINSGVILSLLGTWYFGWAWLDPVFGFILAIYILFTAVQIVKEPLQVLMDKELNEESRLLIAKIVTSVKNVKGFHELKTRSSGPRVFIQLHIDMDKNLSFQQAHDTAEEVIRKIEASFPGAEVLVHEDPV